MMDPGDLEGVYETLAETLDRIDPEAWPLYLAKLALLLAEELGDAERARALIEAAAQDLRP